MNFLAHLFAANREPAFQVGCLLPDFLDIKSLAGLSEEFGPGIRHHREVDRFTDAHPAHKRTARRIGPPYERFGAIIADVVYDHFLIVDWASFTNEPLRQFTDRVYRSFEALHDHLPPTAQLIGLRMRSEDWLCSYGELSGIQRALNRIGTRLRRQLPLGESIPDIELHYEAIHQDFREFFPDLLANCPAKLHSVT
jgi:acyl carrier protein phosphodiesterase